MDHHILWIFFLLLVNHSGADNPSDDWEIESCEEQLLTGQYLCSLPEIDPDTQEVRDCSPEGRGWVQCEAVPGITCGETGNSTFFRQIPCRWTNGCYFDTALILSIFLGMFGIDRIYLGYPAIGALKFATLGFFFIGHLVDVILIATQTLKPADNSSYIISYFGAGLSKASINEHTYRREQGDWFEF